MSEPESSSARFQPVPVRCRGDGWTPARQRRFLQALCQTRSVAQAAAAVGISRQSAYRLRARRGASSFRAAWDGVFAQPGVARPVACPSAQARLRQLPDGQLLRALKRFARLRAGCRQRAGR